MTELGNEAVLFIFYDICPHSERDVSFQTFEKGVGSRRSSLPKKKKKKKRAEEELNEYKRDGEEVKWTARSLRVPKVLPNKKSNEIRLIFSLIPVLLLFSMWTLVNEREWIPFLFHGMVPSKTHCIIDIYCVQCG